MASSDDRLPLAKKWAPYASSVTKRRLIGRAAQGHILRHCSDLDEVDIDVDEVRGNLQVGDTASLRWHPTRRLIRWDARWLSGRFSLLPDRGEPGMAPRNADSRQMNGLNKNDKYY